MSLFWSRFGSESGAYVDDLRAYLRGVGARTRGGAAISAHLLLGVSAEWLQETGGIHDGSNTRVKRLFEEAKSFAEMHIGGVYAMRMDLDERGSGVVDIFATHTHMRRGRPRKDGTRGKDVHEVSIKEALSSLQRKAGGGKSFAALQTLWAHHAATNLDCRIVRGVEKTITGREHLTVAEYRQSVEAEKSWKAERDGQRKTILNTMAFIGRRDEEAEERGLQLDQREVGLKTLSNRLADRSGSMDDAAQRLKEAEERFATREKLLDEKEKALATRAMTATQHEERNEQRGRELVLEKHRYSKEADKREEVLANEQLRLKEALEASRIVAADAAAQQHRALNLLDRAQEREEELQRWKKELKRAADEQALSAERQAAESARLHEEAIRREKKLAADEHRHREKVYALEHGLDEILNGRINSNAHIVKRPELAPAADLLKRIGSLMVYHVERSRKNYEQLVATLQKERAQVAEALKVASVRETQAAEREAAAFNAEQTHRETTKAFVSELGRLRRVRDLAKVLASFSRTTALRKINEQVTRALDGLARELDPKTPNVHER